MKTNIVPLRFKPTRLQRIMGVLFLFVILVSTVGVWKRVFSSSPTKEMAPLLVNSGPLVDSVPVNAILVPHRDGIVSSTSGGVMAEVLAVPGQAVTSGAVLARLTNADLERQLGQAQSELAAAKADHVFEQSGASNDLESARLEQIKATNALGISKLQMDGETVLQSKGIISAIALEKTRAEYQARLGERSYAQQRVRSAATSGAARIKAAAEKTQVISSRVDSLQEAVDHLTLRAPFDGLVSKLDAKPGITVTPGASVAEVITPQMDVSLEISESDASRLRPGTVLQMQNGLTGSVTSVSPVAEGGIVKGHGSLLGDTRGLRSNTTLQAQAVLATHGRGLFVQADGLDLSGRRVTGQVVSGSRRSMRALVFGPRYGNQVVVLQGASAGETIVALARMDPP